MYKACAHLLLVVSFSKGPLLPFEVIQLVVLFLSSLHAYNCIFICMKICCYSIQFGHGCGKLGPMKLIYGYGDH